MLQEVQSSHRYLLEQYSEQSSAITRFWPFPTIPKKRPPFNLRGVTMIYDKEVGAFIDEKHHLAKKGAEFNFHTIKLHWHTYRGSMARQGEGHYPPALIINRLFEENAEYSAFKAAVRGASLMNENKDISISLSWLISLIDIIEKSGDW